VECRRIKGKPRSVILEYVGTADTLLKRLRGEGKHTIKTYAHGETAALLNMASELDVIDIINKHVPTLKSGKKPKRDGLTVGASILLAAMGRACRPTSKMGWWDSWCKGTSLPYILGRSLEKLDSQHFWDQMDFLPEDKISKIEEELIGKLIEKRDVKLDCLFFDTTNFFTFIDTTNTRCDLPKRGRNKQKRFDLRQIGMALLVSRKDQLPLFHQAYEGNKNDITTFKEIFDDLTSRLRNITEQLADVTMVFDKGNNSKENFKMLDGQEDLYYVGGLVSSHFMSLIEKANKNFATMLIDNEELPVYRIKQKVWGAERTCVVTVSKQLKEGQILGIHQHLEKKYKKLEEFKQQLESPKRRKEFSEDEIKQRVTAVVKGQFIDQILKYEIIKIDGGLSYTYFLDEKAFDHLIENVLGRKILVTNRHDWSNEEIILAYRGQAKVEYAFKSLKNPYHLAVRPQFHWTDQKIRVHFFICVLSYLLTVAAYSKARTQTSYKRNIINFMDELKTIRMACTSKNKGRKITFQLEKLSTSLKKIATALEITDANLRPKLNFSDYT
jgi:transposase